MPLNLDDLCREADKPPALGAPIQRTEWKAHNLLGIGQALYRATHNPVVIGASPSRPTPSCRARRSAGPDDLNKHRLIGYDGNESMRRTGETGSISQTGMSHEQAWGSVDSADDLSDQPPAIASDRRASWRQGRAEVTDEGRHRLRIADEAHRRVLARLGRHKREFEHFHNL
jgi:molybdenum-dependent DNA-binding transcriptional regulator ModE